MAKEKPMIPEYKKFIGFFGTLLLVIAGLVFLACELPCTCLANMVKRRLGLNESHPVLARFFLLSATRCYDWSETPEGYAFQPFALRKIPKKKA